MRKKQLGGDSCGGVGLLGKRRGNGPLWVDWEMKGRGGGGLGEREGGIWVTERGGDVVSGLGGEKERGGGGLGERERGGIG